MTTNGPKLVDQRTHVVHVNDDISEATDIERAIPRFALLSSVFSNSFRVQDYGRSEAIMRFHQWIETA